MRVRQKTVSRNDSCDVNFSKIVETFRRAHPYEKNVSVDVSRIAREIFSKIRPDSEVIPREIECRVKKIRVFRSRLGKIRLRDDEKPIVFENIEN